MIVGSLRCASSGEWPLTGAEVQVDAQAAQLARLEQALFVGERLLARGAHREIVGEDRHPAPEHHDPSALVIGRHEQPPAERALEAAKEIEQPRGGLEVAAIEDEARRARVAEQSDVRVVERRARQTDHQALADEVFEIRHVAILVMAPSRNGHPMNHERPA